MRKTFRVFVAVAVMMTFGCKEEARKELKKKLLPTFTINIPDINLRIPPIAFVSGNEIPVGALRTPINLDSAIRANTAGTLGATAVTSVKVKKVVLELSNADSKNNLSNFESARMRIYSDSDTTSIDIANIQFPDSHTDSLDFRPIESPEISKYLKGSMLGYNLFWKNRKTTTKFLKLVLKVTLSVQ